MGWSSGTSVIIPIIKSVSKHVKDVDTQRNMFRDIIQAFEDHDWDNIDEALGINPVFDAIAVEMYPELEDNEHDD